MELPTVDKNSTKYQDEIVLLPYHYIAKTIGNKFLSKLLRAINSWLQIPEDKFELINNIINTIYCNSLLIDDIEDNSKIRLGMPTAHSIYGIPATINATNYVIMQSLQIGIHLNRPEALNIMIESTFEMIRGQGMEIYWRENRICPDEEEFTKVASQKSVLMMMGVNLMQLFSEDKHDYSELIDNLGLYLQMRNDYTNLSSEDYMKGKSFCEDLTEGKYTLPIIHAIKNQPKNGIIEKILHKRTDDIEIKKYCLSLIKQCGSLEYAKSKLDELDKKMRENLRGVPNNSELIKLLDFPQLY